MEGDQHDPYMDVKLQNAVVATQKTYVNLMKQSQTYMIL